MTYVVERPGQRWEVRQSRTTPKGPRSRTLSTFQTLTTEVIERASARSDGPIDPKDLRSAALRAGAPIGLPAADRAAGELLGELAAGRQPRSALGRLLADALGARDPELPDAARAAGAWVAATPAQRGEALRDLLLLADRLPRPGTPQRRAFPRVQSSPA
ncbi:MAG: hypothetical protein ACR2HD_09170 [Solirubrobacteraceae bacterium]|nr:MAG: hypothetical protein DLM63_11805 [Solirubrobacterales bacterium]